jgi:hypothetical protein
MVETEGNEMANFALFAGDAHYPAGGWDDLIGTFDTVAEARARFALGRYPDDEYNTYFEWGHIVDLTHAELILVWGLPDNVRRDSSWDWVRPAPNRTF